MAADDKMIPDVLNIVRVEQLDDYRLSLTFDDGTQQVVDSAPFLKSAEHPAIRAYLDPARFASLRLEYGELVWGDHDLCFPLIDLSRNRVGRAAVDRQAA